ncbi:uncharacterized protein LOC107046401 [Diachasma alloeum]|uniref:uncharacterized protein LOC107046401 n=1 Tax=Diachasma alloeum TaxID=454923 RepID=UPI000738347B|nr:uncharacterized protein LOC107046401 [Diachasma alloeum]
MTAGILDILKRNWGINAVTKGKHMVLAFMDDIKCHAQSQEGIDVITRVLIDAAKEMGLSLNNTKCGVFAVRPGEEHRGQEQQPGGRDEVEELRNEAVQDEELFLPEIREGYKYLEMVLEETRAILTSRLAVPQKIHLFNTSVVPAATYILGNLYPDEQRRTSLLKCSGLDTAVRKILVEEGLKGYSTTTAGVYLASDWGLAKVQFGRLASKGWRNPITDARRILVKYGVEIPPKITGNEELGPEAVMSVCRRAAKGIEAKQEECYLYRRMKSLAYARTLANLKKDGKGVCCPVLRSRQLEVWAVKILIAVMEDQIPGLGSIPDFRRMCLRSCGVIENSYHVSSACVVPDYIHRHDFVVYWLLREVLAGSGAPKGVQESLKFGSATLNVSYDTERGGGHIQIRAGGYCAVDVQLYHYKPDLVIITSNPRKVYVIEVSVAHLQNLENQEKVKRTRYETNSEAHVTPENMGEVHRGENLVNVLKRTHGCDVELGVLVLGCFGVVAETAELVRVKGIVGQLGVSQRGWENCLSRSSYSVATATPKVVLRSGRVKKLEGGLEDLLPKS